MKRASLIIILLMLLAVTQANASCSDGSLDYGDSCEDRFGSSDDPHIYGFVGEQGDLVTVTLTWEDDAEGTLLLVGPLIEEQESFDLSEQTADDSGEIAFEGIELPEDGLYGIAVTFDDRVDYEIAVEGEAGDEDDENDEEPQEVDTAFLDDTVLLFQSAEIPEDEDGGYFYNVQTLTAEGATTIIDTNRDRYTNGCGDISSDGEFILYTTNADANGESVYTHFEIYSARIDGSRQRRLTETESDDTSPRWSPDGEQIVFMSTDDPTDVDSYEIFVMDADGDNLEQITDNNDADRFPSWSPDGDLIIFHSNSDGDYELYTMDPDGDDVEQLTDNDWNDARAMFSPDGDRIVYNANEDGADDLFVMDADGDNIERLTESFDSYEFGAVWSPDGEMIAFTSTPELGVDSNEIWVINADGSDMQSIYSESDVDFGVCGWSVSSD